MAGACSLPVAAATAFPAAHNRLRQATPSRDCGTHAYGSTERAAAVAITSSTGAHRRLLAVVSTEGGQRLHQLGVK